MKTCKRVLLADADDNFRAKVEVALAQSGQFEVVYAARTGEEVLAYLRRETVDTMVMDILLPGVDGLALLQVLDSPMRRRVVVASALSHENLVQRVLAAGAYSYVAKPCDASVVVGRLQALFAADDALETDALYQAVTDLLVQVGVPAHLRGYQYLRAAILLMLSNNDQFHSITKTLYPQVAAQFQTTPVRVERSMRHAIETAWQRGDEDTLRHLFGCGRLSDRPRPTNGEFVAILSERLRLRRRGHLHLL